MTDRGIARKYARAFFQAVKKNGKTEEAEQQFHQLTEYLKEEEQVRQFLFKYPVGKDFKKEIVNRITSGYITEFVNFLHTLVEKGRFHLLELIYQEFVRFLNSDRNIHIAELQSAFPLQRQQVEAVAGVLSRLTGKEIKVEVKVNPDLKGGFIARVGDAMIDASVSTQLKEIYQQIVA